MRLVSMFRFMAAQAARTVYEGELLPADLALPVSKYAEDPKTFGQVITASAFLPRVMLYSGKSEACLQGKIGMGRYGLVRQKDQIEDLTPQMDCLPLSWRFKAMRIPGDGNVFSYYNPKAEEFQKIIADSEKEDSGCMYGVEFLIWLPNQTTFATYFLSSKTARREAPNLKELMAARRAATLKVQFIKKGKYSWHGPVITPCSTPFPVPDTAEILDQATKFANPKDSEVETADAAPEAAGDGSEARAT